MSYTPHWVGGASEDFKKAVGEEAKQQGLFWGGDWTNYDWAHVQLLDKSELKRIRQENGY